MSAAPGRPKQARTADRQGEGTPVTTHTLSDLSSAPAKASAIALYARATASFDGRVAEAVALLRHAEPHLRDAAMNALRGMLSGKPRAVAARH